VHLDVVAVLLEDAHEQDGERVGAVLVVGAVRAAAEGVHTHLAEREPDLLTGRPSVAHIVRYTCSAGEGSRSRRKEVTLDTRTYTVMERGDGTWDLKLGKSFIRRYWDETAAKKALARALRNLTASRALATA